MPKKITMWKCELCGETFDSEEDCIRHEKAETDVAGANQMLYSGSTLKEINDQYKFWRELPNTLENVTKDNCFVVSHWQCCNKPAYRIRNLEMYGTICPIVKLYLFGCGSWSGYYGGSLDVGSYLLKEPHPKEELFIDKRYFN